MGKKVLVEEPMVAAYVDLWENKEETLRRANIHHVMRFRTQVKGVIINKNLVLHYS